MNIIADIWNHFEKSDDENGLCKYCGKTFSYSASTRNLKAHFLLKHVDEVLQKTKKIKNENSQMLWEYFSKVKGNDKVAACNLCDRIFSYRTSVTNLKIHLIRTHSENYLRLVENLPPNPDNVSKNTEPDDSNDESRDSTEASTDLWSYFEHETGGRARCVVCRATIPGSHDDLKSHLKKMHPKLLTDNQDSNTPSESEDHVENTYTEVVYLEEDKNATPTPKQYHARTRPEPPRNEKRRKIEHKERKQSSEDENKKQYYGDDELDVFTTYISCLLKKIPKDVCYKLQMDIINLIMKEKINCKQTSTECIQDSFILTSQNNQLLTKIPVTISNTVANTLDTSEQAYQIKVIATKSDNNFEDSSVNT